MTHGIISNYLPELQPFFGDFVKKYGTLEAWRQNEVGF